MKVEFHKLDDSVELKFSVIVAKDDNGYVCVRHKDRDTWEAPGGHLEHGETPRAAAERELKEETGAVSFLLDEVCNYSVRVGNAIAYGRLCFAEIFEYSGSLDFETAEIKSFSSLPKNLTYPEILPLLLIKVENWLVDFSEVELYLTTPG
jgi:8-oxo-dGTP diphosphatase